MSPLEFRGRDGCADDPDEIAGGGMVDGRGQFAAFVFLDVPEIAFQGID